MRHHSLFLKVTVVLVAGGLVGCSDPTGSLPAPVSPAPASPVPTPGFPPLPRPGTIYLRTNPTVLVPERYVLFEDSSFALQIINSPNRFLEFKGRYARQGSEIELRFDEDSRWVATAIVGGDSLVVKYNIVMRLSDFEDGVFRSPTPSSIADIYVIDSTGLNPVRLAQGSWPAWSKDAA